MGEIKIFENPSSGKYALLLVQVMNRYSVYRMYARFLSCKRQQSAEDCQMGLFQVTPSLTPSEELSKRTSSMKMACMMSSSIAESQKLKLSANG